MFLEEVLTHLAIVVIGSLVGSSIFTGEANIEFVLFIVFAPFVIYTLIDSLNALLSKK